MSKSSAGKVIASIGLGVALGTALGFYALAPNVPGGPAGGGAGMQRQLNEESDARQAAEQESAATDDVLAGMSSDAVRDELKGQSVVLFATPDANSDTLSDTRKLVQRAGANVTGVMKLTDKMLQQDSGDEVKSIAANSLPAGAQLSEDNLNPGMHSGELLGASLAKKEDPSESDRSVALGALEQAGFIEYEGEPAGLADLALVIGAGETDNYVASFLTDFSFGLDKNFEGAVFAGTNESAEDKGTIGRIRENREYTEKLTTVDNVDSTAGRITVVRALKQQADGEAGHYGSASNAAASTVEK